MAVTGSDWQRLAETGRDYLDYQSLFSIPVKKTTEFFYKKWLVKCFPFMVTNRKKKIFTMDNKILKKKIMINDFFRCGFIKSLNVSVDCKKKFRIT